MDSDEPQQPQVGEPAGQQLKRSREKLGLSIEHIAEAQHLRPSIIQSIEDGDYAQIESELFLKGYVRAYARQVGADADALIHTLDEELEPLRKEREAKAAENPLIHIEQRKRRKRRIAKFLVWVIVLGGIGLALWTFYFEPRLNANSVVAPDVEETTAEETLTQSSENVTEPAVESAEQLDEPEIEQAATSEEETVDPVQEEPIVAGADESALAEQQAESDEPEAPALTQSPAADNVETATTEMVESEAEITRQEPETIAGESSSASQASAGDEVVASPASERETSPDQVPPVASRASLQMSFVADCWVQVTDAAGTRLVSSLKRDGDRVNVTGRAPLTVVVGAVDAVDSTTFAGEPVDISSFRVINNRTEFELTL